MAKIVIIGLGTAGISACLTIRKKYPKYEVVIIDKKEFDLLHSCGLPFLLDGRVDSPEKLKYTLRISGIKKYLNCEAIEIACEKKTVKVKNLKSGERKNISYNSLILTTGATPFIPPIPGLRELKDRKAFIIKSLEDIAVLLTSSFEGKVWYEKQGNKLVISGDKSGEVSYRLSAPRVDYQNWDNLAEDQSLNGIKVTE